MLLGNRTCGPMEERGNTWVWETLWKAKSKAKLKAYIAETLVLDHGNIKLWLFTSKNGTVLKRTSKKSTFALLLQRFQNLHGKQQMASRRNTDFSSTVATLYRENKSDTAEISINLADLNKICANHTAPQRYSTSLIQFKIMSRTGEQICYHNTYQAPTPENVRGVVSTSTYRVRRVLGRKVEPVVRDLQHSQMHAKTVVLSKPQQSLDRVQNMNRKFNNTLDQISSKIVQVIQNRRKVVVTNFTAEYSINTDGIPVFIKAVKIKVCKRRENETFVSSTIPRRVVVEYGNQPGIKCKHNGQYGKRLSSTNNRALQFHTRDHKLHMNQLHDGGNDPTKGKSVIRVRRKKCHGDFCGYKEAGDAVESEFERPQSSSSGETPASISARMFASVVL